MWERGSTSGPDPASDPYLSCICVPTLYYWSIPFSAMNSILSLTFSHVCQIYVAEVLTRSHKRWVGSCLPTKHQVKIPLQHIPLHHFPHHHLIQPELELKLGQYIDNIYKKQICIFINLDRGPRTYHTFYNVSKITMVYDCC